MNECVWCGKELGTEAPEFVGGRPMHRKCEVEYRRESDEQLLSKEEADAVLLEE